MASTLYDPIMDALLALLEAECGSLFKTYSRKLMTWENMLQSIQNPGGQIVPQPALYLYDGPGFGGGITKYVQGGRTPAKRALLRTIVIYDRLPGSGTPGGADSTTPGASSFYPLIESVEDALTPADSDSLAVVTLGGRVTHCWIEGDGVIVPGDIDPSGQGMATIPVNILIP